MADLDVAPGLSAQYALDRRESDAIHERQRPGRLARCPTSAHLAHESRVQHGARIPLSDQAFGMPPCPMAIAVLPFLGVQARSTSVASGSVAALLTVVGVLLSRACRQMGRLIASRGVARMLNLKPFGDRPNEDPIRDAVDVLRTAFKVDQPIAAFVERSGPEEAFAVSDPFGDQARLNGNAGRILLLHRGNLPVSAPVGDTMRGRLLPELYPREGSR